MKHLKVMILLFLAGLPLSLMAQAVSYTHLTLPTIVHV